MSWLVPSNIILLHDLMYGNTDPFYHVDLSHHEGQWASGAHIVPLQN